MFLILTLNIKYLLKVILVEINSLNILIFNSLYIELLVILTIIYILRIVFYTSFP